MNSGRLFHARGPATTKARSPSDVLLAPQRRQERMTIVHDTDRSLRRDVTSATG